MYIYIYEHPFSACVFRATAYNARHGVGEREDGEDAEAGRGSASWIRVMRLAMFKGLPVSQIVPKKWGPPFMN